jgi:hypothetical protein
MNKILYENKLRIIDEIEEDHIHLDDGTVIRKNEILKLPFINISLYSEKQERILISKKFKRTLKDLLKIKFKIRKEL